MSFVNPFPLKGIHPSDTLERLCSEQPFDTSSQINHTRADFYHRVHRVGDMPVAFVDALTGLVDDVTNNTQPATAKVAEHIDTASYKIEQFLAGKDPDELVEAGCYIGICLVGATVSTPDFPRQLAQKEIARLAIFQPTQFRII